MKPKTGPQDLPPKGGYASFNVNRIKLRNFIKGRWGMAFVLTLHFGGWYGYSLSWKECRKNKIQQLSTQLATFPIFYAERDRAMLKHIKRLRDIEEDIMKDFPFWEVGTYFGVPLYESLPKNVYVEPHAVIRSIGIDNTNVPFETIARMIF